MTANFSLKGKVALVTGASSGLGRAFAGFLANAGACVILGARRKDKCIDAAAEIGDKAFAVELDVTDTSSINTALEISENTFGPVTILINNAGIVRSDKLIETSEDDWQQVVNTNLGGCFLTTKLFAKQLISRNKKGRIINVSSMLGNTPSGEVHAYAASKAGINQLTRTSALELSRYGISVNAIAPGYIETDLNRDFLAGPAGEKISNRVAQRRFGQISELEGVLLLLSSAAGSYLNGEVITVDGGLNLNGM
tara:strand:+ start:894 stop:1652 length:759 start_codon:yes stop_codon:yes gene_type:complete